MELNYCLTVAALKVLSAFFGYRCLREAPLLCMEALDSFDRRMSGHWYAAVLRHLGADDGVGGGGELLFRLTGTRQRAADTSTF